MAGVLLQWRKCTGRKMDGLGENVHGNLTGQEVDWHNGTYKNTRPETE